MSFHRAHTSLEINLNYEYITDPIHIDRIRADMGTQQIIEFDTETTGLSFLDNKILLYQIGTENKQYVLDARTVPIQAFKDILESDQIVKMIHNAKFDYLFTKAAGITMERMADTMLAECCLTAGIMKFGRGLEDCMARYFNYNMDKALQKSFVGMTEDMQYSEAQLRYAALDVAVLRRISDMQIPLLRSQGLLATSKLESAAVPVFGDMEFFGMHFDKSMWLGKLAAGKTELLDIINELNNQALQYRLLDVDIGGLLYYYRPEITLAESMERKLQYACSPELGRIYDRTHPRKFKKDKTYFNWASTYDVGYILDRIYPGEIKGTGADELKDLYTKYKHPMIKMLQTFRGLAKSTGTYGMSYVDHVHSTTGKFHPEFNQYGTDTGRPTGKKPNMLNIPRNKAYRNSFCAPPDCDWHTRDYSGCELRIIASMSKDPSMCRAFNEGKDLHTYVAAKFMNLDYDTLQAAITAGDPKVKEIRQACKSLNFGIIYGMGPAQLAADLNLELSVARGYYYGYRKEFKVMVDFLEKLSASAVENGYSTTVLGRRRFFRKPTYPKAILQAYPQQKQMRESLYAFAMRKLPNYRQYKESVLVHGNEEQPIDFKAWVQGGVEAVTPEIVQFFKESSGIQRAAGNHPVQGGNADITKHAMVNIRKRLQREKYYPKAHMVLQVYDEICLCAPTAWRSTTSQIMEEEMVRAGEMVIKGIPVLMDAHVGPTWTK